MTWQFDSCESYAKCLITVYSQFTIIILRDNKHKHINYKYIKTMATSTLSATSNTSSPAAIKNPQLKRVVYSKYRELLGSYNDKANAIIETLPAYMVREDRGFQLELPQDKGCLLDT